MLSNADWRVVHYETADGTCPVREFLDGLTAKERAKVLAAIDLLEEEGPNLHRPYSPDVSATPKLDSFPTGSQTLSRMEYMNYECGYRTFSAIGTISCLHTGSRRK